MIEKHGGLKAYSVHAYRLTASLRLTELRLTDASSKRIGLNVSGFCRP